jgi:hypothetical protein
MVRNTIGKATGMTQHLKARRESAEEARKYEYQAFREDDLIEFSKTAGRMTEMGESDLEKAKPVAETVKIRERDPLSKTNKEFILDQHGRIKKEQEDRIRGLYKRSMGRLGEVRRSRLRPGARKQSLITRKY